MAWLVTISLAGSFGAVRGLEIKGFQQRPLNGNSGDTKTFPFPLDTDARMLLPISHHDKLLCVVYYFSCQKFLKLFLWSRSQHKFNTFWLKATCCGTKLCCGNFCSKQRHRRNIVNPLGWGDCRSSFPSAFCQFSPGRFPVFIFTASGWSEAL